MTKGSKLFYKYSYNYLTLILLLLTFGCTKSSDDEDRKYIDEVKKLEAQKLSIEINKKTLGNDVYTVYDIYKVLSVNGIQNLTRGKYFDDYYIPVTNDFVFRIVGSSAFKFFKMEGEPYKAGRNDCDDYSLASVVLARRTHYELYRDKRPVSILFGEFHYIRRTGENHAINCFINEYGKLMFFEPQLNNIIYLTPEEISSATYWRF